MKNHLFKPFLLIAAGIFWVFSAPTADIQAQEPLKIVALGDSLTAGYQLGPDEGFVPQLQKALSDKGHNVEIVPAGVSGDTSTGGLARLDWSVAEGTKGVILELGANDALRGISPEITRENLQKMIARLKERNIEVLLAGMVAPPNMGNAFAEEFNPIYPQLAEQEKVLFYPFFLEGVAADASLNLADGIHPNPEGIKVIVTNILPKVEELISEVQ